MSSIALDGQKDNVNVTRIIVEKAASSRYCRPFRGELV